MIFSSLLYFFVFLLFCIYLTYAKPVPAYCAGDQAHVTFQDFLKHTYIVHSFSHRNHDFVMEPPPRPSFTYPPTNPYYKPYNPFVHVTVGEMVFPHQASWECRSAAFVAPAWDYVGRLMLGNEQDLMIANVKLDASDDTKTRLIMPLWEGAPGNIPNQFRDLKQLGTDAGLTMIEYKYFEGCTPLTDKPVFDVSEGQRRVLRVQPGFRTSAKKSLREAIEDYVIDQKGWMVAKCPDDTTKYDETKRFGGYVAWDLPPYEKLCITQVLLGSECWSEVTDVPWWYDNDLRVHGLSPWGKIHIGMNGDDDTKTAFCSDVSNYYLTRNYRWGKVVNTWITAAKAKNLLQTNDIKVHANSYAFLDTYRDRLLQYGFASDLVCAVRKYSTAEIAKEAALEGDAKAAQVAKTKKCKAVAGITVNSVAKWLTTGNPDWNFRAKLSTATGWFTGVKVPTQAEWGVDPYTPTDLKQSKFLRHNPKTYAYLLAQLSAAYCTYVPPVVVAPVQAQAQAQPQAQAQAQAQDVPLVVLTDDHAPLDVPVIERGDSLLPLPDLQRIVGDAQERLSATIQRAATAEDQALAAQSSASSGTPKGFFNEIRNQFVRKRKNGAATGGDSLEPLQVELDEEADEV